MSHKAALIHIHPDDKSQAKERFTLFTDCSGEPSHISKILLETMSRIYKIPQSDILRLCATDDAASFFKARLKKPLTTSGLTCAFIKEYEFTLLQTLAPIEEYIHRGFLNYMYIFTVDDFISLQIFDAQHCKYGVSTPRCDGDSLFYSESVCKFICEHNSTEQRLSRA